MPYFARTDTKTKLIEVNKKKNKKSKVKGELIDSLVHEKAHLQHPRMHEKTIRGYTDKIVKRLSSKAKKKLYSKLK